MILTGPLSVQWWILVCPWSISAESRRSTTKRSLNGDLPISLCTLAWSLQSLRNHRRMGETARTRYSSLPLILHPLHQQEDVSGALGDSMAFVCTRSYIAVCIMLGARKET